MRSWQKFGRSLPKARNPLRAGRSGVCIHRDQRGADCHWVWTFGTVFCSRDRQDLWQLYRHEKAGTCPQSLYPVCTGTRRHHVWHGIDDRPVFHCTRGWYRPSWRSWEWQTGSGPSFPAEIVEKIEAVAIMKMHPLVDRDAAGKPFDHSAVFIMILTVYGNFQAVQCILPYRPHPHFHLCGRTLPVGVERISSSPMQGCVWKGRSLHCTVRFLSVYSASPPLGIRPQVQ